MNIKLAFLIVLVLVLILEIDAHKSKKGGKSGKGKSGKSGKGKHSHSHSDSSESKSSKSGKSGHRPPPYRPPPPQSSSSEEEEGGTCGLHDVCDRTDTLIDMVDQLMKKKPCEVNIPPGSHCECAHERQMGFLIVGRDLPAASLTASSEYSPPHHPNRARLDADAKYPCSWSAATSDNSPYIEVNFGKDTVVFGAVVQKRCDHPYENQYVTSYKIQAYFSGFWEDVHRQSCKYSFGVYDFGWFSDPVSASKYRLVPMSSNQHTSLRFDLIGYL